MTTKEDVLIRKNVALLRYWKKTDDYPLQLLIKETCNQYTSSEGRKLATSILTEILLKSKNHLTRDEAAKALGYPEHKDAFQALQKAMKDSDEHVRASATNSLGCLKLEESFKILEKNFWKSKDSGILNGVINGLINFPERAFPIFKEAIKRHKYDGVRASCSRDLGTHLFTEVRQLEAIPIMVNNIYKDKSSAVRSQSVIGLYECCCSNSHNEELMRMIVEKGIPAFKYALNDLDNYTRDKANEYLPTLERTKENLRKFI